MNIKKISLYTLPLLAIFSISNKANADDGGSSESTRIEASVTKSCSIQTPNDINFGIYDATSTNRTTKKEIETSIYFNCNKGSVSRLSIEVTQGNNGSILNSCKGRRMKNENSDSFLNYQLFINKDTTEIGCSSFNEYVFSSNSTPNGFADSNSFFSIKGVLPGGQGVSSAGDYLDSVDVRIVFWFLNLPFKIHLSVNEFYTP